MYFGRPGFLSSCDNNLILAERELSQNCCRPGTQPWILGRFRYRAGLLNLRATPDAQITRLELRVEVFNPKAEEFCPLTAEEFDGVAFPGKSIKLRSEDGEVVSHDAPNGKHFTVRELIRAVEETERQTRSQSEWLGGVDVHHIFFEGIHNDDGDVWEIYWGA